MEQSNMIIQTEIRKISSLEMQDERMVWSIPDYDSEQFSYLSRTFTFISPDRVDYKFRLISRGYRTTRHPAMVVKFYDRSKQLISEWNSGVIPITCTTDVWHQKTFHFPDLYNRVFDVDLFSVDFISYKC